MQRKYMFHVDSPKGELFNISDDEENIMRDKGWVDSPGDLDAPIEKKKTQAKIKADIFENISPDVIAATLSKMGYVVFTVEQFEAEKSKAIEAAQFESVDSTFDTEESQIEGWHRKFFESPTDLTKVELKDYAEEAYGLILNMKMKEATMIEKITEARIEAE